MKFSVANWLAARDGRIHLVMRPYWSKTEAPILPAGERTGNPPAPVKAD